MKLSGLQYQNDVKDIDQEAVLHNIKQSTRFTFSFLMLLLTSTIICTLGLLLGSAPFVIGGMLISPLMWPIMKIAAGITFEQNNFVKQALDLFILSLVIILACSFVITYISPVKVVNEEIMSRASPTLIDIIVAFAAGAIAAFALLKKKISDSLAGVAIATSLLPPLCVSGIGLALFDFDIASGAFLLFMANVVSIIFVSVCIFILEGIKRRGEHQYRMRGLIIITIMLVVTALPLMSFLATYSFKAKAYTLSEEILTEYFKTVSASITVENIKTNLQNQTGGDVIIISADVLVPENISLDYNQKNDIVERLERELEKKIELNLRVQRSLALKSQQALAFSTTREMLIRTLSEELRKIDSTINISSLEVNSNPNNPYWQVDAVLLSNPGVIITEPQRDNLERTLQRKANQLVVLNIELISRLKLKSQPELENDRIKNDIEKYLTDNSGEIDIISVTLQNDSIDGGSLKRGNYTAVINLHVPKGFTFTQSFMNQLKTYLENNYGKKFTIKLISTEKNTLIF